MLWWNNSKQVDELEKELPDDLKDFFHSNNPEELQKYKYEVSTHEAQVTKKLASLNIPYSSKFDLYKKQNTPRIVGMINCSELESKIIDCFKNMSFTNMDNCSKEIQTNKTCIGVQIDALKRLHYEDCYSIEHCDKIRFIVDHLFVKTFGQYGEEITDATMAKFNNELDSRFDKIWK